MRSTRGALKLKLSGAEDAGEVILTPKGMIKIAERHDTTANSELRGKRGSGKRGQRERKKESDSS